MKKFMNLSQLIIALLLTALSAELQAQPISPVDQGNLPQFMDEMDSYYQYIIQIPLTDIEAFVSLNLPTSPNGCEAPFNFQSTNMTDSSLTLEWQMVSAPSGYKIGYVNLVTGNTGYVDVSASVTQHVFNHLPNGYYLFTVKAECQVGNERVFSPAAIIIVSKEIVQLEIDRTIECGCNGKDDSSEIAHSETAINLGEPGVFDLKIISNGEMLYAITFKVLSGQHYSYNPDCSPNPINEIEGLMYIPLVESGNFDLSINSVGLNRYALIVNYDQELGYMVEVDICGGTLHVPDRNSTTGNDSHSLAAAPNPFSDHLTLSVPTRTDNTIVAMFDFAGRQVLQSQQADATLDTSQLPAGVYYLKIKNDLSEETQKVVKF